MSKNSNLVDVRTLPKEEHLARCSKGGKNSVLAKRKKKHLKECLELLGENFSENLDLKSYPELKENKEIIKEAGIIAFQLFNIMMDRSNSEATRLNAIKEIIDRTEGKVVQKQEVNDITGIDLAARLKEAINRTSKS